MKKLSIIAGLAFLALATQAQPGQRNRGSHKGDMERNGREQKMAQELNLSEAQKSKMKEENQRFHSAMKTVKDDPNLTAEMMEAKRKSLNEEHRANMKNILTPEQRQKAESMRKEHAGDMHKHEAGKEGKPGNDRMRKPVDKESIEKLNLSQDQKAKLESARQEMQREMQALKNNSSLSQEERRSQMKQIHERHLNSLRSTLTPEQYTQWQAMQQEQRERRHMPRRQPAKTRK